MATRKTTPEAAAAAAAAAAEEQPAQQPAQHPPQAQQPAQHQGLTAAPMLAPAPAPAMGTMLDVSDIDAEMGDYAIDDYDQAWKRLEALYYGLREKFVVHLAMTAKRAGVVPQWDKYKAQFIQVFGDPRSEEGLKRDENDILAYALAKFGMDEGELLEYNRKSLERQNQRQKRQYAPQGYVEPDVQEVPAATVAGGYGPQPGYYGQPGYAPQPGYALPYAAPAPPPQPRYDLPSQPYATPAPPPYPVQPLQPQYLPQPPQRQQQQQPVVHYSSAVPIAPAYQGAGLTEGPDEIPFE